jgi:hypothetical protein
VGYLLPGSNCAGKGIVELHPAGAGRTGSPAWRIGVRPVASQVVGGGNVHAVECRGLLGAQPLIAAKAKSLSLRILPPKVPPYWFWCSVSFPVAKKLVASM